MQYLYCVKMMVKLLMFRNLKRGGNYMTFEQLYYFCEVYRQKSFSNAANNLKISRQSLSFSIKRLEEELETVLFFRNKQGVIATQAGGILYEYAQNVLMENWKVKKRIFQISDNTSPVIHRIAVCDYVMGTIGKELYAAISEKFPEELFSFSVLDANIPIERQTDNDVILTIVNQMNLESKCYENLFSDEWSINYLSKYLVYVWISGSSEYAKKYY